jgi:hypothetical protein
VNKKGHTSTLVAVHPGNRNAVKSGVYSPATLAPRIYELEASIAERDPDGALTDILRRELAAMTALGEAMDQSFASDGVVGRRGEPRTMVAHRLRLDEKIRQAAHQYVQAARQQASLATEQTTSEGDQQSLAEMIAKEHGCPSIDEITPGELDLEVYLRSVIMTVDRTVTTDDRLRARRMLTTRCTSRSGLCLCFSTLAARNELELRHWIDGLRKTGVEPWPFDMQLAALVRRIASGERVDPWVNFRRTEQAVYDVVAEGADPNRRGGANDSRVWTGETDGAIAPFWQITLSADPEIAAKDRLKALRALDDLEALPRCTCEPEPKHQLDEEKADAYDAYAIRLVAKKHYRAALHIARYPETYLAVRDAIDARIVSELGHARDGGATAAAATS